MTTTRPSHCPGYAKRYELDRVRGIPRSPVPVEPVRARILSLLDYDFTPTAVARAVGVSKTAVVDIASGRTRTVRRPIAARVMRTTPLAVIAAVDSPHGEVPSRGSVRRVQALLALGHSHTTIQQVAGCSATRRMTESTPPRWVTKTVADAVDRAYRALSMRPGTSTVTRTRAARAGYVPPLGWDDIDLDPTPAVADGKVTIVEEAEWLARAGEAFTAAATRLGYTRPDSLEQLLRRSHREDVLHRLLANERGAAA